MAKRNGFFKRIGEPVILTVGRSNQLVKTGDVILADFDSMMERQGWQFVPKFDPAKAKMEVQRANPNARVVPPAQNNSNQMLNITEMKRREMTVQPRTKSASETMIDKKIAQLLESNVIKLSSVGEVDERALKKEEKEVIINLDALKELKKYSNKDWFGITKEKCKEILDAAHIDYSHIPSEKWPLVTFIKSVIKDIEAD